MTASRIKTQQDRVLTSKAVSDRVDIRYDFWGVPHIRATGEDDLFFANGYAHAADRLWQMDAARRRALGRFAEWVGEEGVAADALMRRLGMEGISRADFDALAPETRRMCDRYAEGVNAFIAENKLPPEYALLDEVPEPWEGWHCVLVMRQRGILMGSVWFKLWRAAAYGKIGPDNLHLLRYEDGGDERFVIPQDREAGRRWVASLDDLSPAIEELARLFPQDATGGGSNNWAVDARHSTTGMPILAGDPHRAYEIPGMYTQLHLTCDKFDALGFSVPGVPGLPHFGHNADVAWGLTHAFADIHDLYIEDFADQAPGHYRTKDGPKEARYRQEQIAVRDKAPVNIDIWETDHGPLIVGRPEDGAAIAIKSMQLQAGDRSLDVLRPMLSARNITAFYDVMEPWGLIDHSLVAADRKGAIGVLMRARVPDRDRLNGWLPVPGWTGDHEWRGIIPFDRMPREERPESGIIATANNRPVPDDWPDYICTDCHPATRAKRIHALLREDGPFDADDMLAILYDHHSERAKEIAARLLTVTPETEAGRGMLALLEGWDGSMEATQAAPTAYYLIRQQMTRILTQLSGLAEVGDTEIGRLPPGVNPLAHLWWALPDYLRRDDVALLGGKTWDAVMIEAIDKVAEDFRPEPWGHAHRPHFVHPLAGMFPDAAEHLAPTSAPVSGDGDCVLATGGLPPTGTKSTYGPVSKYIWDLADWDRSSWVVLHGASGNPDSPHYRDQNEYWARGDLVPAPYSEARVAAHTAHTLSVVPSA